MNNKLTHLISFLVLLTCQKQTFAIEIIEASAYLNSSSIGATSIQDTQISQSPGTPEDQFGAANLSVNFVNNLDADSFGTISWSITNNSGSNLSNITFIGFLDAQIDSLLDEDFDFFNEYGDASNFTPGTGSNDSAADSWEIDEPGLAFGDIIDNLFTGNLDNFNNVPQGLDEDTSLALGFEIGSLLINEVLTVTFEINQSNNGGLLQFDPDANSGFYFNGFASVQSVPPVNVNESSTLLLFIFSLALIEWKRRKYKFL